MSERKQGKKPGQMANKAKQGTRDQSQRMERDSDRMADDQKRDMDRLGGGMKRDAQQARPDTKNRDTDKGRKEKLQHH
jgi:hypothetical protein